MQTEPSRELQDGDLHPADDLLIPVDADTPPRLSVVMPTLNEASAVGDCIERAKDAINEVGITAEIIVSDSSTDQTPAIAREHGAIVVRPEESGYGAAYRYAFEHVRGDIIVMGDADGTYDFRTIPSLLSPLINGEADLVIGNRFGGEIEPGAMPFSHRYVGNPLLTRFLNLFYDADVTDAHTGFRAIRRRAIDRLDLRTDGMEFASEMIMQASIQGLSIVEVPIAYYRRTGEPELNTVHDGWRHIRFMLVNAPGYLFSVPGLTMTGLGPLVMLFAASDATVGGVDPGMHSMVAGSLLTVVGYQVFTFGVFATVAGDPLKRPNDPLTVLITDRIQLRTAVVFGGVMTLSGVGYTGVVLFNWVRSGFTRLPLLTADFFAFTAIVIGLQTVFGAFFMSFLGDAD